MNVTPPKPTVALMLREQQEERESNIRLRTIAAANKAGITSDGALNTSRLRINVIGT